MNSNVSSPPVKSQFNIVVKIYKSIKNVVKITDIVNSYLFKLLFVINVSQKRCSHSTIKSYQRNLPSPFASTSSKKPQIAQVVSEAISGFSLINKCFLLSCSSKSFGLFVLETQLFKVSIVNFSSIERVRTAVAADRIFQLIECCFTKKWNMFTLKVAKVVNFISFLLEAPENYNFIQI